MAAAVCPLPTVQYHCHRFQSFYPTHFNSHRSSVDVRSPPHLRHSFLSPTKFSRSNLFFPSFSGSQSCDSPSSPSSPSFSYLQSLLTTSRFLTPEELEKLQFLEKFTYRAELPSGHLCIRVMRSGEMDMTVELLSESFAESMLMPTGYVKFLGFLVKQYLTERMTLMPHTVTLVGYYRGDQGSEEEEELAGTVELSFDEIGANSSPPTPIPPKNCPYICNMTVKKHLRRRGIGWHLLKASEELISKMSSSREAYLHCRMIDSAPFSMYQKSGYDVVKTDSIFIFLTLQRRKYLMRKILPTLINPFDLMASKSEYDP